MNSAYYKNNLTDYINALATFTAQLTPSGDVKLVNKAAAEASGLPIDSFIGKAFKDCYWWNFSSESRAQLEQDIQYCGIGKRIDREAHVRIANNQFIHMRFILTPIKNTVGQVDYLVAEGLDITERTQRLNNLSDYINALDTLAAQLTPEGDIKLVNKAAIKSSGLPLSNFIGKTFQNCLWWNFSRESQAQIAQDITECAMGKRIDREVDIQVADGQFIIINLILTPITNAAGKVIYLVAEGQNITQRKQLELTLIKEKEMAEHLAFHD
ncbi:MAG: PAS domain-containing protein, partial [Colwellia sp.]